MNRSEDYEKERDYALLFLQKDIVLEEFHIQAILHMMDNAYLKGYKEASESCYKHLTSVLSRL